MWLNPADLDAEEFQIPEPRAGEGDRLREAAKAHITACNPAGYDERRGILQELRLATVARNESDEEARAAFRLLVEDLRDIPADILREACHRYRNSPKKEHRFFPRQPGQLRAFANPLIQQRRARAHRLRLVATACDEVFDESTKATAEDIAAIRAEFPQVFLPAEPERPARRDFTDHDDLNRLLLEIERHYRDPGVLGIRLDRAEMRLLIDFARPELSKLRRDDGAMTLSGEEAERG